MAPSTAKRSCPPSPLLTQAGTLWEQVKATASTYLVATPADGRADYEQVLDTMPLSALSALLKAMRKAKAEGGPWSDHLPPDLRGRVLAAFIGGCWREDLVLLR